MMRKVFFYLLSFICSIAFNQTIRKVYYFSKDSTKGIEKVVEVLRKDTNIIHGSYTYYYHNGKQKIAGQFLKNKPVGLWNYYYESGEIKQKINYKTDSISHWTNFFENGQIKSEGKVINNRRDSTWSYYYENGAIQRQGNYFMDLQDGQWKYFYEDGEYKANANYSQGTGYYTENFYKGGIKMMGPVTNNETDGVWTYFFENGKVKSKGFEKNGVKNGEWLYYHPNDTLASRGNYINGQKDGDWEFFHKNGEISSQGIMNDGLRDGLWKMYNTDGGFKAEANLINGTGWYKEYYPNNKLKISGLLKEDKNDGEWSYFYEDGTLEGKALFTEGEGSYTEYYQSGEQKMTGTIKDGQQVGTWQLFDKKGQVIGLYKLVEPGLNSSLPMDTTAKQVNTEVPNPTVSYGLPRFIPHTRQKPKPFEPRYGESRGFIFSMNPTAIIANELPVSVEYFIQERLGQEFKYVFRRGPFLISDANIQDSTVFTRGFALEYGQKFYSRFKNGRGMFYLSHSLRYDQCNYFLNTENKTTTYRLTQKKIEYAWMLGDRALSDIRSGGITLDFYVGMAFGLMLEDYNLDPSLILKYKNINRSKFQIIPRAGFMLGYLF